MAAQFKMLERYANHYKAWRAKWGKDQLTAICYGGVPGGDAWNPVTWTLFSEVRMAATRRLALPQYGYLSAMFHERKNPMYTRLYYAVTPREAEIMVKAREDFDKHGFTVRGVIYDGLLAEGVTEALLETHGLVEKPLPRWEDSLFMLIRAAAAKTTQTLREVAHGTKMCICNALLNVGGSKIQKAVLAHQKSGQVSIYMNLLWMSCWLRRPTHPFS